MLIRNGKIVDGSGNAWFRGDVLIKGDRIARVGNIGELEGEDVLDASGRVVAPGFIDAHSHSDFSLIANPSADSKVMQGITTEINGMCGFSAAPLAGQALEIAKTRANVMNIDLNWQTFGEYLDRLDSTGLGLNSANFVGANMIRSAVMGNEPRPATDKELGQMKELVAEAIEQGARGLSDGLEFVPGCYFTTEGLIELCKVAADHSGVYMTHQRERDILYERATEESIRIARESDIHVHLAHFVVRFPSNDKTPMLLWMVDQARREGLDITFDVIVPNPAPLSLRLGLRGGYHWAAESLATKLIPPWGFEGGIPRIIERLKQLATRQKFTREHVPDWKLFGVPPGVMDAVPDGIEPRWDWIIIGNCRANPHAIGKTIAQIAAGRGVSPRDACFDLILEEAERFGSTNIRIFGASTAERDSVMALSHIAACVSTDRAALAPYGPSGSIRDANAYGAFPRCLRVYVRERAQMSLEEMVRKMTSSAAAAARLENRGLLASGKFADIVIFDEERIADNATIEEPQKFAEGIDYVIVNGEIVMEKGELTGKLSGRTIRSSQG